MKRNMMNCVLWHRLNTFYWQSTSMFLFKMPIVYSALHRFEYSILLISISFQVEYCVYSILISFGVVLLPTLWIGIYHFKRVLYLIWQKRVLWFYEILQLIYFCAIKFPQHTSISHLQRNTWDWIFKKKRQQGVWIYMTKCTVYSEVD